NPDWNPGSSPILRNTALANARNDRTGLTLSNEENPALGLRGVRLSLARPKVADTQLRAILRASAYGKLRVLVPMISTREELLAVRRRMLKLSEQLRAEGH
ncbi:putative PEP-binding protein, partial [Mesorhizobium sp. M8A.F.Ca.ET.161.01.1.1]|uniref:putative PEP-binding protein n=1 Tax=Mesorhizobium sp. M8A.F.Ca.ET.161.01.1.1 TaxID=2563959 RepID=UPI0032B2D992